MHYIIYLIGIGLFVIKGIGTSNLSGFIDSSTLVLVILPCLLMLFCTKSFKPFGESFLFIFGKRNYSLVQCKRCLQSIKIVILTSVISGIICFTIAIVNTLRHLNASSDYLQLLGLNISVALLSLFYVLLLCILLLPLYAALKQYTLNLLFESDGKSPVSEKGN